MISIPHHNGHFVASVSPPEKGDEAKAGNYQWSKMASSSYVFIQPVYLNQWFSTGGGDVFVGRHL